MPINPVSQALSKVFFVTRTAQIGLFCRVISRHGVANKPEEQISSGLPIKWGDLKEQELQFLGVKGIQQLAGFVVEHPGSTLVVDGNVIFQPPDRLVEEMQIFEPDAQASVVSVSVTPFVHFFEELLEEVEQIAQGKRPAESLYCGEDKATPPFRGCFITSVVSFY